MPDILASSLLDLIEKAPSFECNDSTISGTFVREVLEEYNAKVSNKENVANLYFKHTKSSLVDTIRYLGITHKGRCYDLNKLGKLRDTEHRRYLAMIICNRLRAFHHNKCNLCSTHYNPVSESIQGEDFSCVLCGIGRHNCARDIPSSCLWVCQACSEEVFPIYANHLLGSDDGSRNNSLSLDHNETVDIENGLDSDAPTPIVQQEVIIHTSPLHPHESSIPHQPPSNATASTSSLQETDSSREAVENENSILEPDEIPIGNNDSQSPPPQPLPTDIPNSSPHAIPNPPQPTSTTSSPQASKFSEICPYLKKGICKYGAWGLQDGRRCPNFHPVPCEKFLDYGAVLPKGCNKGASCRYYHLPFFCKNSIKYLWCDVENCSDFHHTFCSNFKPLPRSYLHPPPHTPTPPSSPSTPSSPPPSTSHLSSTSTPHPLTSPPPSPPSTPNIATIVPPPPISTQSPTPATAMQRDNHQPASQNFATIFPNFHPPPFRLPYYPIPPYFPPYQPIPLHYPPPKPTAAGPLPHLSQPMVIPPQLVSVLEDLLVQMRNVRNS